MNCKKYILVILFFYFITGQGLSQIKQSPFEQMLNAYQQLDYQAAKTIGKKITAEYAEYSLLQLVETHKILGVIAYTEGNLEEAQKQFEQVFSIDDKAQLDSVYVSPKIIQFFDELKQKFIKSTNDHESSSAVTPRYILIADPRPTAALRSLVFPGWGQLYKQQKKKGYAMIGSAGLSILGTGILHFMQKDAHENYLNATGHQLIDEKYKNYNTLYKWRNNLALFTGGVWLYSFFDALISSPNQRRTNNVTSVKIIGAGSDGMMISAQFQF